MFATLGRIPGTEAVGMNLKCDPQQALILREQFASVIPGYHMNKTHWNTILLDGSIPEREILWMIDHSYALVVRGLPRAARTSLEIAHGREALYRGRLGFQEY
jgi:predicted DNA-binding protein (MmcQ/YjbR family)